MTSQFTKKDIDEIKPILDKTVLKFLGFSEPSLVTTAINCLASGYDKIKTANILSTLLDESKAIKLAERIFEINHEIKEQSKVAKKRMRETEIKIDEPSVKKTKAAEQEENNVTPSPGQLSAIQIKEMMLNAQKMIEERKRALSSFKQDDEINETMQKPIKILGQAPVRTPSVGLIPRPEDKFIKTRAEQLQASINAKFGSGIVTNALANAGLNTEKPTPLILDSQGRTVDMSGKEVQLTLVTPTLKANIRAKKREEFKAQLNQQSSEDMAEAGFFDPRINNKPSVRNKRALRFHEPGKFRQLADRLRTKAQLEKLQGEIFQIAKKTGISSAAKLALIAPKTAALEDHIPDIEWWDSVIVTDDFYTVDERGQVLVREDTVSHLVEHPTQMRPPTEPMKPSFIPVFLTKKERKKLRRQNRREAWKEEQEKIRLGLEPPPEPKLRISNLMRVLGTEAVQDPTKMEAHVRAQMAKRQKAHEEANAARRLTAEQRKDKKIRKLKEDTSLIVYVSVYRVSDLQNQSKKFKVEANAKQLFLSGCVILIKDCNLVVVEGGPKQISKYNRLMMTRIKWEEDLVKNSEGIEVPNKCVLVWKGTVPQRHFGEMKFKVCPTEKLAREHLKKHNVEHYWDLAYSGCVLENTDEVI